MVGLGKVADGLSAGDLKRSGTLAYGWRMMLAYRWRCAGVYAGVAFGKAP